MDVVAWKMMMALLVNRFFDIIVDKLSLSPRGDKLSGVISGVINGVISGVINGVISGVIKKNFLITLERFSVS